ncbi:MAG: hypothetical protein VX587_03225 [Thermoproteota archaeon]|nr:hypothetical protein [Thermoproteota archaeon]
MSFTNYVFAEDQTSESEIAAPDLIINFDDTKYWYGLESGETPYWKIEDGVGKFYLESGTLEPGERQLESASIDFQKLLGDKIGEDWVLRYKITFDEFEQGTDSSWSQLLIGLFSKPTSGNEPDITHGDANQWGVGTGFMTGVDMTRTMLMYDLGFYLQWHSEPDKGHFKNKNALPDENRTFWIEYRKMKSFLTVSIFDNENYARETLIEKQHTEGWANVDELRYLRIFPLIETNTSDGKIIGTIDDLEFYNNKRWVTKNFDEEELEEMKTFEERLQDLFDKQNQINIDTEKKQLDKLKREKIPDWLKFPTNLWVDSTLSNSEFFRIIDFLIQDDIIAIPLSNYASFDATYKPQTIKLPTDPVCITCVETDLVNLRWKLPDELSLKGSNTQIFVHSPDNKTTRLTTASLDSVKFEITSEFIPGLYNIDIIYANEKFQAPSLLLITDDVPQLPFWIKHDAKKWANDEITSEQFKDVLYFILKEKFINIEPSDYIKPNIPPKLTDKQILLSYFPTDEERKQFEPFTWKYFDNYARGIFQYRAAESMLIETSVGKILHDNSRQFDPIYNEHQVPYILMELYKYKSNEDARTFVDQYPRIYNAFFEQSDMSGTSVETGDCMYNNEKNFTLASQDEIHMIICIYNDLALLITVYEDHPTVDSSLIFKVADTFFEKIHDGPTPKLENVLKQNIFEQIDETQNNSSDTQDNSSEKQPSLPPEQIDPELSGAKVGIQNFSCIKDDFGFVEINGEFSNAEKYYEKIVFSVILKSYDGKKLAQGDSEILSVQPFEVRKFDGYVALDEPFYECNAIVNWEKSE